MNRIKTLVNTAFPEVDDRMNEKMCVNTFTTGIIVREKAACALVTVTTPNEAVSICSRLGIKGATGYRQGTTSTLSAAAGTHLAIQDTGDPTETGTAAMFLD